MPMLTIKALGALLIASIPAVAGTINFTIDTSAINGSNLKVVFDITANTLNLNQLDIENFSAPGAPYGSPETTGGLVDGDLILLENPAPFTFIDTSSFFNELIVNLQPVKNSVTFTLFYTQNAPSGGALPDEVAFFLLDSSYMPLFPTADPLGTDALFAVDLNGSNTTPNVYAPAVVTSPGNVKITVPGATVSGVPEPGTMSLILTAFAAIFATKYYRTRRSPR
jgi:hypothetical protein